WSSDVGSSALAPARADVPRTKFHYDWHWQWDYGNGDLGNQGVHEMDKARWGLGKTALPKWAFALGGRFGYEDDGETANTQICFFDYGDCELIFEVRGLETQPLKGAKVGNIFYGSQGGDRHNHVSLFDCGDCELIFEVRGRETQPLKGAKVGNIFYGSEGYAVSNSYSS